MGEDTRTQLLDPEASKAANLDDFPKARFLNGVGFAGEGFGGDGSGVAATISFIGLVGIGGAVVGEMLDKGACKAPTFRFRCISKSPICHKATDNRLEKILQLRENATFKKRN